MERFWSEDAAFLRPFDVNHWMYIAVLLAVFILLVRKKAYIRENSKKISMIVLGVSLFQQILLYTWYSFETGFHPSVSLPLHISRISTLLGMVYLLTKSAKVMDILFYFSLFAYGSFLYPMRVYAIEHVMGQSFLINHIITLLLPYYAHMAYGWKPAPYSFLKAYGAFLVYFAGVLIVNPLVDGNYFYLKYRPFFTEWPEGAYNATILVVVFAGYWLAYQIALRLTEKDHPPLSKQMSERR
ncbi:TIGR02206 family membrane protein [Planomicrobium sp. CPCC 101110]|uniref:YwaF family protein n=1 Tax=Planomicrobium sp. CPCC 101110 TaxID=2599619 RepID=UPI0011B7CFFE|nr:TIGR02206 family membrane protein [Planomicrobium sp. CPCC 101110]TWT27266.1 TIGR02206 family membrane protein [Planomicrobium sp. CPCC 101110]